MILNQVIDNIGKRTMMNTLKYHSIIDSRLKDLRSFSLELIIFCLIWLSIFVSSCTSQEEKMKEYKQKATFAAWEQEQELVNLTIAIKTEENGLDKLVASGTHQWSEDEIVEIQDNGEVKGYEGRYIKPENNFHLATNPDNIVFVKIGLDISSKTAAKALKKDSRQASLRSYLLNYEKNKYALLGGVILSITILLIAFKRQRGMIIYPAFVGAALGTIRLGVVSGWSILPTLGGLASGLIMGTMAGLFLFLVIISVGVG
jgi:hypothetical protein